MEPHTGPFSLTYTPAGFPPTTSAMHAPCYLPTPFPLFLCLHCPCTSAPRLIHQAIPDVCTHVSLCCHGCPQLSMEALGGAGGWEGVKSWDEDGGGSEYKMNPEGSG